MASEADHVALANKNHDALFHLMASPDEYSEWITTITFYKAVQIVEAVLSATRGRHSPTHADRLSTLKRLFPAIHKHFRVLWSASTIARYLHDRDSDTPYSSFQDYLPPDQVIQKMVNRRLDPIEQIALPLLSDSQKGSLKKVNAGSFGSRTPV
jgi:hypothetical protein